MNFKIVWAIVKTFFAKDVNPDEINKPWYKKQRYIGGITGIIGIVLYSQYGLVLDNDIKDIIRDNYLVIVSGLEYIVMAAMALWGIFVHVKGQVNHATKKTEAIKTLAAGTQEIE
jgi:hypothetical protein